MTPEPPNVARLLRENAVLRAVAVAAARARRIGLAVDQLEEGFETLHKENPHLSRSASGLVMAAASYQEAMRQFDSALLTAADVFAREPFADEIAIGPRTSGS